MINLSEYIKKVINEEYKEFRINEITATYNAKDKNICIEAPAEFNESDIQQYINDMWLEKMPSGTDYSAKFFGKNNDSIYDIYFEYDNFEHLTTKPSGKYIEFDSSLSPREIVEDDKLDYFKLHNLRYIIKFDRFDLQDAKSDNIKETLIKIFKSAESNSYNKWPIDIVFDEKNFIYIE